MTLLVTVLLLLGNAFFVGAEFALIASRRTVIEPLAASSRKARSALRAMNEIPLMVAGAQVGVTVCSLGLGAIAEPALAHLLTEPFDAVGLGRAAHPVAFVLALGVVVFAHAVKTVFTAEELAGLVGQSRTEGLLDAEEHARITGALALSQRTARDALRPWSQVITVPEDVSPAALEVLATRTGRSRFPVVARATRRVLGFVHVKDVLGMVGPQRRATIPPEIIRPLAVVPPDRTLAELLLAMRRERRHIVLVSDGRAPLGVVTLDDVLNAVVGEPAQAPSVAS